MIVKTVSPEHALAAADAEMFGVFDVAHRDCCRTAGWAFERLFDVNPVVDADYTSHLGALKFLRKFGKDEACHDFLATRSGLIPCQPTPGVIGAVNVPLGQSGLPWVLGINIQADQWATMGPKGLCIVNADARCWGVPLWD